MIRRLQAFHQFDPHVVMLDVRDRGLHLIWNISSSDLLVIVCTITAEGSPGELRLLRKHQILADATTTPLALQEPGLKEALLLLELTGEAPTEIVLVRETREAVMPGVIMTPAVEGAVPRAELEVLKELFRAGCPPRRSWLPVDPEVTAQSTTH